jgi:phage baseplate assembly protein W
MSTLEKNLYKRVSVPAAPVNSRDFAGTYKGFSTVQSDKNFKLYDLELIKQDIINHLHIRKGEKLSDPSFGTIIWDVLFEPFTEDLKLAIQKDITEIINYDPRVSVTSILVESYEQGINIEASLNYLNYDISETLKFQFDQRAGLT